MPIKVTLSFHSYPVCIKTGRYCFHGKMKIFKTRSFFEKINHLDFFVKRNLCWGISVSCYIGSENPGWVKKCMTRFLLLYLSGHIGLILRSTYNSYSLTWILCIARRHSTENYAWNEIPSLLSIPTATSKYFCLHFTT